MPCGGPDALCCNGLCRDTETDEAHCGGCGVACPAGAPSCLGGYCRPCDTADDCQPGFACNEFATPHRCQCNADDDCPLPWQTCDARHQCRGTE